MSESELADLFERPPRPRLRIGVGAAVVLVLVVLAGAIAIAAFRPTPTLGAVGVPSPSASFELDSTEAPAGSEGATTETLLVHVVGAVGAPGVYEVPPGARVVDGIAAAGGLAADADPSLLNMARLLVDGEQLHIPRVGEAPVAPVGAGAEPPGAGGGPAAGGIVNLNTATAAELEELPRIGPAMAARIIDFREQNGGFTAVEELKEVAGVGDATYEGLVDLVTV